MSYAILCIGNVTVRPAQQLKSLCCPWIPMEWNETRQFLMNRCVLIKLLKVCVIKEIDRFFSDCIDTRGV